jgi:hypothetical protein
MQREPGKRDYGSSDCAALRSLASRGVNVPQNTPKPPPRSSRTERPRHEQRRETRVPA